MTSRLRAYPAKGAADLAAYDDLPAEVRARLRATPVELAAIPLHRFWIAAPSPRGPERQAAILRALDQQFPEMAA